ncbi:hypothetical protein [Streptomyces nogalater]|uniref:Uncharacterized protein n=1 Tax=Streptomyces nogalater TaxID=38314 RepID=A0ABW0WKF1_STRNO
MDTDAIRSAAALGTPNVIGEEARGSVWGGDGTETNAAQSAVAAAATVPTRGTLAIKR